MSQYKLKFQLWNTLSKITKPEIKEFYKMGTREPYYIFRGNKLYRLMPDDDTIDLRQNNI